MKREDLIVCLIFVSILAVAFGAYCWVGSIKCHAQGKSFDDVDWGAIQGCMVKHNDRWLPLENIRGFNTKE